MTRAKKKLRLGVGAVVPDGPNAVARDYLLAAITKWCPGMVDELATIAEGALDERQARLDKWIIKRCSDPWLAQVARDTEESWRRDAILRRHRHWQHAVSWWGVGDMPSSPRSCFKSNRALCCIATSGRCWRYPDAVLSVGPSPLITASA